ncbi:BON domain-containing protein [Cupriavidus sp. WKF15]|uniref:BON domain-containing protein n=1 Tax=Cupriavidus sp. WKF15 TaxID=3032282 RepID=UPI0023E2732B|nr:BON domain-containing protein [Cupriavidus sp. WKF15]WER50373.1 BON domain-containing protein [Cupriavidus sp. WKF15]
MKADLQLKNGVDEELNLDPAINAAAVGVDIHEGVVTLSGHLLSYAEKLAAERAAEKVSGLRAVVVNPDVRPASVVSDEAIATAARDALQWERIEAASRRHAEREAKRTNVSMRDGTVTLSGHVGTRAERLAAIGAAWSAPGVGAVVDNLQLS